MKNRQLLILISFILLMNTMAVSGVVSIERSPSGTYSFDKDGSGQLVTWVASTSKSSEKLVRWEIDAYDITATGDCKASGASLGKIKILDNNNAGYNDALTNTVTVSIRLDVLFKLEIKQKELTNAWGAGIEDGDKTYLCYQLVGVFSDSFTSQESGVALIKIYNGTPPIAVNTTTGLLVAIFVVMAGALIYLTIRRKK